MRTLRKLRNDLSGKSVGKLLVLWPAGRSFEFGHLVIYWTAQCECGTAITVPYHRLSSGNTKSCGCRLKSGDYAIRMQKTGAPTRRTFGITRMERVGLNLDFRVLMIS